MLKGLMMEKLGYNFVKANCYAKKIDDVFAVAEEKDGVLFFYSYCASPVIDNEYEIDSFLKQQTSGMGYSFIGYGGRKLEIVFRNRSDELDMDHLKRCTEIITVLRKKFDILPCCMKCGTVSPVKLYTEDKQVKIFCDVCRGSTQLTRKHEKMIQERKEEAEKSGGEYIEILPTKIAIKIALKSGLLGALLYLATFILSIVTHPALALMPWIPAAAAGYYAMSRICKMDIYNGHVVRVVAGTVVGLLTMIVLILTGYIAITSGLGFITGGYIPGVSLFVIMADTRYLILLALIIGGYVGAEVIAFIIND